MKLTHKSNANVRTAFTSLLSASVQQALSGVCTGGVSDQIIYSEAQCPLHGLSPADMETGNETDPTIRSDNHPGAKQ